MKKGFDILILLFILSCFLFVVPVFSQGTAKAVVTKDVKLFQEKGFGYSIQYPADWIYRKQDSHILLFSRKDVAEKYVPIVGIQNLLSTKAKDGKYPNLMAVIEDFQNQIKITKHAKVFPPEPFIYNKRGLRLSGQQFIAEYNYRGVNNKQYLVAIPRLNGDIFHVFIYSAPENQYDIYFDTAKAMLDSWIIEK